MSADDDNVIELRGREAQPPIRTKGYSCTHSIPISLIVDLKERTVECARCKQVIDPIEAFEILCRSQSAWRRVEEAKRQYQSLEQRIEEKKRELAKLQREVRKAR